MSDAPLKLLAFDTEDLAVLSAHMQDAVMKVGDTVYLPRERRFAFAANRFDWEQAAVAGENRRRRTAVHFERVTAVRSRHIPRADPEVCLNLLAIAFEPGEEPGGTVLLHFSGDACIRLEVECLEGAMKDLGPAWQAAHCPEHHVEGV